MDDNRKEICERLRLYVDDVTKEYSCMVADCMEEAADLIESQAIRIQQQALEYVSLFDQCSEHLARIAELEKERDDLIHDNAQLVKAATAEAKLANEAIAERDALKEDAARYEYLLDCEVESARLHLPSLDADKFRNLRRAHHSAAIQAEKETRS